MRRRPAKRDLCVGVGAALAVVGLLGAFQPVTVAAAPLNAGHPDLTGVWRVSGDLESASAVLPAGGDVVGWAPVSQGSAEYRLAHRPSKEARDAATRKAEAQIIALASGDLVTRLGHPAAAPLPGATPKGQKAYEELNRTYNIKYHNEHCYAGNIVSGVTSDNLAISQSPARILIAYDTGYPRIIYMDGRDDSAAFASMFGFSVGRWDGDVLVVKTTKITGKFISAGLRLGWPMTENITLTEYYRKSADGKGLTVRRVFTDPAYYREPMESMAHLESTDENLVISPCVEFLGNEPFAAQEDAVDKVVDGRK